MNIGLAIRAIRKELNFAQKRVAADCGITQTSLSQIEHGVKRPSPRTMQQLCTVLEVPEVLFYIIAIQEDDIPECRKDAYKIIYPTIVSLSLQLAGAGHKQT